MHLRRFKMQFRIKCINDMTTQDVSIPVENSNDIIQNLQAQLAEKMIDLFDLVVSDRRSYFAENPDKIPDEESIDSIINSYSATNGSVSGAMGLVPGPWGMVAVIPELLTVIRNQLAMIYDIGMAHGKSKVLTKELLAGIFITAMGASAGSLLVLHGNKVLVSRVTLRVFQKTVSLLAGRVTQQALKSAISKWLPIVGAAAMATWSIWMTQQTGKKAKEVFSKDIEVSENPVEEGTKPIDVTATTIPTSTFAQADVIVNSGVDIAKIQTLINLMRVDGTVKPEEREYIKTILCNANLTSNEIAEMRQTLSVDKKFSVDYTAMKASPDDAIGLLVDLITLAKRDGTFHITEKMYIKQVGRLLGFSDSDIEETIVAIA